MISYLELCIGPSWDLDDHVEDSLLLIGKQGDVVKRRKRCSIFLDEATVFEGVGGTDLAGSVLGGLSVGHGSGLRG
jgi:hypothetical protein